MSGHDLIDLEERGWHALADSAEAATHFYRRTLDERVVMLLPGGLRLDDREAIAASMGGQPWGSYELEATEVVEVVPGTGLVTYGVVARRDDSPAYSALVSSLYV